MDAVIIATPPETHAAMAIKAMNCGKHVLSEVPAVNKLSESEALRKAVAASSGVYMLAENCNYWPAVEDATALIRAGSIGEVFYMEGEYLHDCRTLFHTIDGQTTWRWSYPANILYCTHTMGPLLQASGHRPVAAVAMNSGPCRNFTDAVKSNTEVLLVKTAEKSLARIRIDFVSPRPEHGHRYLWHGSKGIVEIPFGVGETGRVYFENAKGKNWHDLAEVAARGKEELPDWANAGGHGSAEYFMIRDFLRACIAGSPVRNGLSDALDMTIPGLWGVESIREERIIMARDDMSAR